MATAIGMDVLRKGGTAPEALIAAGAALSVVMPHFCGLGGDAVWLMVDKRGARRCLLAIGQGIDRRIPTGAIPIRGPESILTTAALVDGWDCAFRYSQSHLDGRAHWQDLLAPAIDLAETGAPVGSSMAFWGDTRKSEAAEWQGFDRIFVKDGCPLREGHLLSQPELASSLRLIAEKGGREFYTGALAARIVDGLRSEGVVIAKADLARTGTRETLPLEQRYRNLSLLAPPAPTQGLTTLQIMGILSRFDVAALPADGADHLHLCVEAVKRAFLDRGMIADPAFSSDVSADLLADSRLDQLAAGISLQQALPWPHRWQHGDTVFLGAIDAYGNAASVLQSIYFDWGSGVIAGDTGILWQNRGAAFSSDPAHPNAFAPHKLPFYTLNPGIAMKDGRAHFVYGTQGADGQPQTLAMLLTRLIDFSQTPEDALATPRFLLGRTFSDSRDSLKIEAGLDPRTLSTLAARGHEISLIPARSPIAGLAGIVCAGPGGHIACHDPRS